MSLGYLSRLGSLGFSIGDPAPATGGGDLSTAAASFSVGDGVGSAFDDPTDAQAQKNGVASQLEAAGKSVFDSVFGSAVPRPASANVASSGTSYTPWLIGGGILAAVLLLSRKKKA